MMFFLSMALVLPLLGFGASACPQGFQTGKVLGAGFYQLTVAERGADGRPLMKEIADPAPPLVNEKGEVEIYGSGSVFVRYPNYAEFERGGCFQVVPLNFEIKDESGKLISGDAPWDIRKYVVQKGGARTSNFLVGGSMHATGNRTTARWPEDNSTRRIYRFTHPSEDSENWVRAAEPIVGKPEAEWEGHSYGGNFFQPNSPSLEILRAGGKDPLLFFYEKVALGGGSSHTDLFVKEIEGPNSEKAEEIAIFRSNENHYSSTKRTIGGTLSEGPRPIQVELNGKTIYLVGFSSGDYPTNQYTVNFLWSAHPKGPYRPLLNPQKTDLEDFGTGVKKEFGLSLVGRPALFKNPEGLYEMLFHGVFQKDVPDNDYEKWPTDQTLEKFARSIFKISVELQLGSDGVPVLKLIFPKNQENGKGPIKPLTQ